ncbi:MAG: hypothetical protein HFF36_02440 [Coprobacillus sp.]|nr:hypothetical protein [Coprobacillus sp.]
MKQYCRYCSNCSICVDCVCCDVKDKYMNYEQAKRVNKCKHFEFNPIDVFDSDRTYKPRKKRSYRQQKLF